ncbi:hypothetical protein [Sphingomonas bacterium]|nr:hypothetical protein [Sphingomonas bacterium]
MTGGQVLDVRCEAASLVVDLMDIDEDLSAEGLLRGAPAPGRAA